MILTKEQIQTYKDNVHAMKPSKVESSLGVVEYVYYLHEVIVRAVTVVGQPISSGEFNFYTYKEWRDYKRGEQTYEAPEDPAHVIPYSKGVKLISNERVRQVCEEGYTVAIDSGYTQQELLEAALCYVGISLEDNEVDPPTREELESIYPWSVETFKPSTRLRNLVKAGALIAAEIDRILELEQNETGDITNTTP